MPGKRRRSQRYFPPPLPPQPPLQPLQSQGSSRMKARRLLASCLLTTPHPPSPSPSPSASQATTTTMATATSTATATDAVVNVTCGSQPTATVAPPPLLSSLPRDALGATLAYLSVPRDLHPQRRVSVAMCEAWLRHVNSEMWLSFSFPVLRKLIPKGYFSRRTSSSSSAPAAAAASASPTLLLGTFPRLRCVSVYQVFSNSSVDVPPEDLNVVLAALPSTLTSLRLENVHHNVSYVHGENSSSSAHSGGGGGRGSNSNGNGGSSGRVAVGGMDGVPPAASDTNDTNDTNATHLTAQRTLQLLQSSYDYQSDVVPSWLRRLCEDLPAMSSLCLPSNLMCPVDVLVSGGGGGRSSSRPLAALVTEVSFSASDVANHHVPWAAFPNLTKLNVLFGKSYKPVDDVVMRTVLSHCSRLTSLSVECITREAAAAFSTPPVAAAATLQELDLSGSHSLHLEDLGHLTSLTSLQSMNLSYAFEEVEDDCESDHHDSSSGVISSSLVCTLSSLSRLTVLNMCSCYLTSATVGAVCGGGLRSLRQLDVSHNRALGATLPPEVLQLNRLTDVNLSAISFGGYSAAAVIHQVCGHLTALQRLNLSGCSVTMEDVRPLTRLPRLRSLNLSGNEHLTTRGVDVLSQLTQLSELSVSNCHLSEEGVRCVGRLTRLEMLNAAGCLDVSSAADLRCLSALTHLRYLVIRDNRVFTPYACHVLRQLTHLQALDISHNIYVGDDVATVLSQHVTSLRFLYVDDNRIEDGGVAQLWKLTTLRVLHVYGNNVKHKLLTLTSVVSRLPMLREVSL